MKINQIADVRIGDEVVATWGSLVETVAVVIAINADGTVRAAKNPVTGENACNVNPSNMPVGTMIWRKE